MPSNTPTGEKKNWWGWATGALNAVIRIGGLSPTGDVRSSWSVTGLDPRHFITMDEDGQRKGWTEISVPQSFVVNAGEDLGWDPVAKKKIKGKQAITIIADHGDITLKATDGKIKLEGDSIEFVANGVGEEGHFMVTANERIEMKSKRILVEGKQTLKLVASKSTLGLEAAVLDVTTDFFTGISKATRKNDTQTGGEV